MKYHTTFKTLELDTPGFLFYKKGKKMSIDYTKLNDQIVKQAYDASSAFLTEAQRQRLFQNKIDRAAAMIRAQKQICRLERKNN